MKQPPLVRTISDLQKIVNDWHKNGNTIGLVPTMGALHKGHLSLVDTISAQTNKVITTIFVNPTQFGEGEDLSVYPRQLEQDLQALSTTKCDLVFAPSANEIYPDGFATTVTLKGLSDSLEGVNRPGHFDGVATVVTKLFMISRCDSAIFGEKDYQQLCVIRRFVKDLNLGVTILAGPTIREEDGLAFSSRNVYLSPAQRKIAGQLNKILRAAIEKAKAGDDLRTLEDWATKACLTAGFDQVDYMTIADAETLQPLNELSSFEKARIVTVARLGKVRLLDNMGFAVSV